jgi:hypothetical protein
MDITEILSAIDAEISRLQQARQAVAALDGASPIPARKRGRPKANQPAPAPAGEQRKRKRNLSPEGRKRIQEAMKRRWAERNKNKGES